MSRSERGGELQRAAEELRDKLGRFASRPRFNREFETAFDFYFGHGLGEFGPLDEADFERFMEWFVYDYPLSNGHRLIELFDLEKRSDLSAGGRRLLRQWLHAHLSLLELVDGKGDLWQMTDLLTGKRLEGVRVPMKTPIRWSLVIGRPLAMGRGYELSANYLVLPPSIKETFIEHLRGEYRRYRKRTPGATVERFLREYGHYFHDLVIQLENEIAVAHAQEERAYRLVHAQAVYDVKDPEAVTSRLLEGRDVCLLRPGRLLWFEGEADHRDARRAMAQIHLNGRRMQVRCWSPERLEVLKGIVAQRLGDLVKHLVDAYQETVPRPGYGAGAPPGVELEERGATEAAGSADRFAPGLAREPGRGLGQGAGKGMDEGTGQGTGQGAGSVAQGACQGAGHGGRPDTGADTGPGTGLGAGQGAAPGLKEADPVEEVRVTSGETSQQAWASEQFLEGWLRERLPALRGSSPRELARRPLGRIRVAELLKQMEYQQRNRFGDDGAAAPAELRRRLGLADDAGFGYPLGATPDAWNRDSELAVLDELRRVGEPTLSPELIDSAVWMWWNYCSLAFPVIRKPAAWAAALHACLAYVEHWPVELGEIAELYGVGVSSVSTNSMRMIDLLNLEIFDPRYAVFGPSAESAFGLNVGMMELVPEDGGVHESVAFAQYVRETLARALEERGVHGALREKAQAFFSSHVGWHSAIEWEEVFYDWFHFDWRVPVMGGRTLLEEAIRLGDWAPREAETLRGWLGRHPSFYVVEGVEQLERGQGAATRNRLVLIDLLDESTVSVDWLRLPETVSQGDVIFARLVPVGDDVISLGPVFTFPSRYREIFSEALHDDRALVERWNGRSFAWDEFRARYSERFYALALEGAEELL